MAGGGRLFKVERKRRCSACERVLGEVDFRLKSREYRRCNQCVGWWRYYRLTRAAVEAMLLAQGGGCYWCGKRISVDVKGGSEDRAVVDHAGAANVPCGWRDVRSLLCTGCNITLGLGEKRGMLRRRARRYLRSRPHAELLASLMS